MYFQSCLYPSLSLMPPPSSFKEDSRQSGVKGETAVRSSEPCALHRTSALP